MILTRRWARMCMYLSLLWIVFFFMTFYFEIKNNVDDDLEQTLTFTRQSLEELNRINAQLKQKCTELNEQLRFYKPKLQTPTHYTVNLKSPSEGYEVLRRRIYSNTKEFWYYVNSELRSLSHKNKDLKPSILEMKTMVDEHYRSLLSDVAKLADVDGYSQWRWQEFHSLSKLVENRLHYTQNPTDCSKAKQLLCSLNPCTKNICGYGCRLHHFVKCLIVAYATRKTMIICNDFDWQFTSGGWENLFLPLSDNCTLNDGETVSLWPGDESSQVVNLVVPTTKFAAKHLHPPYIPVVLPEDLAGRINVLHGDPAVWWIGQFLKYIFRPQPSTAIAFKKFNKHVDFQQPIVGLHIRRSDKLIVEAQFHELEEYMYHVEEYYKLKELNGRYYKKRIYLATDEPALFDEARLKYPEYDIIGDPEISKTGSLKTRHLDVSILNINIDIYFLSHHCDHLVCTFSSNVCRLAYEIMNSLQPDASTKFTSLDDTFYFSGQIRRLNVALISHKADGPDEMDLEVGDEIEVAGNHWDGYSMGVNVKTKKRLLYPTFKVTAKIEVIPFASYPENIT